MKYLPDEYLEFERTVKYKSEYDQGEILTITGAGGNPKRITENLTINMGSFLKRKSYRSYSSDLKVHIPANSIYLPRFTGRYGKEEFIDENTDTPLNPQNHLFNARYLRRGR